LTPLNDIFGQDIAKRIIRNSFEKDRLASTYLFYGSDGLGKWSTAIALTALVNCEQPITNDDTGRVIDACGECRNCRQVLNLSFSELYIAVPIPPHKSETEAGDLTLEYIEQKKQEPYRIITSNRQLTIPINIARAIKRKTALKPPENITRLILFYQIERMREASADSLLKLIEEPPPETIIILSTRDPEELLPTIQSRAQKVAFKPLANLNIADYLKTKYKISEGKATFYAGLSGGSIGQALNFIDENDKSSLRETSFLIFKEIFKKDNPSAVAIVDEFINPNNRGEVELILSYWQSFLADIILAKFGKDSAGPVNVDFKNELDNLSTRILSAEDFTDALENVKKLIISIKRNVHIRPAMADFILDLKKHIRQSS
jgi:DNA polymerase-3 subunit delta'